MTATSQVEQAVNYRVSLKTEKGRKPEGKDRKHRDEPDSCLQQPKPSDRDECLGRVGGAE